MQSSNKSLNLDAYDNTSAYKAHGHRTETVKPINLCINMYIIVRNGIETLQIKQITSYLTGILSML